MPDVMDLYFGTSGTKSEPTNTGSVMDLYFPKETVAKQPIPTPIESVQAQEPPSMLSQAASNYMNTMGNKAKSGIEDVKGGFEDIGQRNVASGLAKTALGGLEYLASPVTAGIHEFIGKPAAGIGGPEFGEKAELLAGTALPVMKGSKVLVNKLPKNQAINAIVDSIAPDELYEGINKLKQNPRLSVMDVFPSVRMMGQKLITTEGTHSNKFEQFIKDRIGSRQGAVEDIYEAGIGAPPNVLMKLNELKKNIKDVGKDINPIIASSGPVDLTNVISNIDTKLKPGITSVISAGEPLPLGDIEKPLSNLKKFMTNGESFRTDAKSIHQFQSALRAKADDLLNSASGQDRQLGYALMNVRNNIVDAIDTASGGKYKPQLAKYRDENQVQDAFDKGFLITKNRPGQWDDRPEFWQEWIKGVKQPDGTYKGGASKPELEAAREGAKIAVEQQIKGFRGNARKGLDIPDVEFNRDKLKMLFNDKDVETMFKRLSDEREISDTNQKMIGNSQTAMRMKADTKVDLPTFKSIGEKWALPIAVSEMAGFATGGVPGVGTATLMAAQLGKTHIMDKLATNIAMRKNTRLTEMLTSTGPDRDELIRTLEQYLPKPKPSMLQRAQNFALPVLPP